MGYLLCSPSFAPHSSGGGAEPGVETENLSRRHPEDRVTGTGRELPPVLKEGTQVEATVASFKNIIVFPTFCGFCPSLRDLQVLGPLIIKVCA